MGTCKYCGKKTSLFSKSHDECEKKHEDGVRQLDDDIQQYLKQLLSAADFQQRLSDLKSQNYISTDDITKSASDGVAVFANNIRPPYHSSILNLISEFIRIVNVPYNTINNNGSFDLLAEKLIKGFIADYFMQQKPLYRVSAIESQILQTLPLSRQKIDGIHYHMLSQAGKNFTKDAILTPSEKQLIDDYANGMNISISNIPAEYKSPEIERIGQSDILTQLQQGKIPNLNILAPILLGKDESVLWCYQDVTMYQEKIKKEYVGTNGGFSFRVMKGVTYRTGTFKGHPVEHSYLDNMGEGSLYITNKNIIFYGATRSIKVPYKKIIGFTPYSDGLEIQRDGANAKRLIFQGFDCSFVLNVVSLIQ